ncbi:putative phage integrase protein [Salmonella enterica]|nr:putative phage integrase protein [Salmonella enterica]
MKDVPSFTASAWLERYEVILERCALKTNTMPGPLTPDGLTQAFPTVRDSTGLKFGPNPPSFHEIRSLAGRLYERERGEDFAQRLLSHKNMTMTKNIWTHAVLSMLWFRQIMEYSSNFWGMSC